MSNPKLKLSETALRLRGAAPALWNEFLADFESYARTVATEMVSSSLPDLPVAQGRAQECARIVQILTNAPDTVEKNRALQQRKNANVR